jgi:archaemetzincin
MVQSTREVQLVAMGGVSAQYIAEFEHPLREVLHVGAFVGKGHLPKPAFAYNKDRQQYHTAAVMRRVLTLREPGTQVMLGVADFDLFVPDTPFVFGEADRESKTALASLFRLRGEGEVARKRVQVEVVHQAGHLIGLSFCEDQRCLMFGATTVAEADRRNLNLCNNCRNELARLRR